MEKHLQRSVSNKPIRFAVFSFTIFFSLIFLIVFYVWVTQATPRRHLGNPRFGFNATHFTAYGYNHSLRNNSELVAKIGDKGITTETRSSRLTANLTTLPSSSSSRVDGKSSYGELREVSKLDEGQQQQQQQHSSVKKKVWEDCDIAKGKWVIDESYPLYTNAKCPFIDEGFNCEGNGRRNTDYMKWRWQPHDCGIPRFNATKMLELIRGKRVVFVGDSINRNQWESMLCLLMGGVKDPKKVYESRGRKITKERGNYCFKFEEYKCTVEYYVSHYLVHESKARVGSKRTQTLRIDTIDKGSSRWKGADILVFNTAHWWSHYKTKAGINYYQEGNQLHPRLEVSKAFRKAISTWASWVHKFINPRRTRILFRTSSPSHFSGGLWNTGGHCKEAFWPRNQTSFTPTYPETNLIVQEVISQMKIPIIILNVTQLSDYRPDAHPSMYGRRSIDPRVQDCSHWCLPGVPDAWNQLLYSNLLVGSRSPNHLLH